MKVVVRSLVLVLDGFTWVRFELSHDGIVFQQQIVRISSGTLLVSKFKKINLTFKSEYRSDSKKPLDACFTSTAGIEC